jgi:serine/threonine-protein kinase
VRGNWTVSGYSHVRELGEGATSRVVLAISDDTDTPVAIKYLRSRMYDDAEFADRFEAEAQLLAGVEEAHLARLLHHVECTDGSAIVMELVNGVSLADLISYEGPTRREAALAVLKGSLLALAAVHRAGVVHRDYKPGNVLIRGDGVCKLIDAGIAVRAAHGIPAAGTPAYMAPELWNGGPATPATDLYAATVVLHESLTGGRPFQVEHLPKLAQAHRSAAIPLKRVPGPLRELVSRGMAKNPGDRPASAAEFLDEVEAVATAEYGPDWEKNGQEHLAQTAGLLALRPPPARQEEHAEQVRPTERAAQVQRPPQAQRPEPPEARPAELSHPAAALAMTEPFEPVWTGDEEAADEPSGRPESAAPAEPVKPATPAEPATSAEPVTLNAPDVPGAPGAPVSAETWEWEQEPEQAQRRRRGPAAQPPAAPVEPDWHSGHDAAARPPRPSEQFRLPEDHWAMGAPTELAESPWPDLHRPAAAPRGFEESGFGGGYGAPSSADLFQPAPYEHEARMPAAPAPQGRAGGNGADGNDRHDEDDKGGRRWPVGLAAAVMAMLLLGGGVAAFGTRSGADRAGNTVAVPSSPTDSSAAPSSNAGAPRIGQPIRRARGSESGAPVSPTPGSTTAAPPTQSQQQGGQQPGQPPQTHSPNPRPPSVATGLSIRSWTRNGNVGTAGIAVTANGTGPIDVTISYASGGNPAGSGAKRLSGSTSYTFVASNTFSTDCEDWTITVTARQGNITRTATIAAAQCPPPSTGSTGTG